MNDESSSVHDLWARFRFAVVGGLLSAPPLEGELEAALKTLAARQWRHHRHLAGI